VFVPDLVVRSRRVVTPRGTRPGAVHVGKGRILGILDPNEVPPGCPVDEAGDAFVLPGLVDASVHVGGSGLASRDGLEATTRAAAAGGVTTVIAMPFDGAPPTTSAAALEAVRRAAEGRCFVDVGFWGGVVPDNLGQIAALASAGGLGFACDLASWVEGHPATVGASLRAAMPPLARIGAPLVVHAELPGPIDHAAARRRAPPSWMSRLRALRRRGQRYAAYLERRPRAGENDAVALVIELCREFRVPTHIASLSSSDALTPIFHARSAHLPLSAGTCPHYLYFAADEIPDGAVEYTALPPIRERPNRELLWAALAGGLVELVASDHRPAPASRGSGRFVDTRPGIASLHLSLSIVWTEARARGYTLEQVAHWMCRAPARLAGLTRKGAIDVGYDADLVVFDPDRSLRVEADRRSDRPALTPYEGRALRGAVQRTYLRGNLVCRDGQPGPRACGRFVLR